MAKVAREARQAAEIEERRQAEEIVRRTHEHVQQQGYLDSPVLRPTPQHAMHLPAATPIRPPVSHPSLSEQRRTIPSSPAIHQFNPPVRGPIQRATISRAEALQMASGDMSMNQEAILGGSRRMGVEPAMAAYNTPIRHNTVHPAPTSPSNYPAVVGLSRMVVASTHTPQQPQVTTQVPVTPTNRRPTAHIPHMLHPFALGYTIPIIHT
ncbi:hypothetical protein FRC12_004956 [Ceratobasidium sp. 428]|nr:hypothetical protein FRC12_004956 [Ceratobasidium sp. 428]